MTLFTTPFGEFVLSNLYEAHKPWNLRIILRARKFGAAEAIIINTHGWNPPSSPGARSIPWERVSIKLCAYPDYAWKGESLVADADETFVQLNQWSTIHRLFHSTGPQIAKAQAGWPTARGYLPDDAIEQFITSVLNHYFQY